MRSRHPRRDVLLDLIELAYAASEDPRLWEPFLLSLAESLGAGSVHLLQHDLTASAVTILRGRHDPAFDEHDLRFLKSLSPHVRRALQIHQRIHGAERSRAVAVEVLDALRSAVFLVDAESTVVLANQKGHKLLAARDGLSLDRGRLQTLSSGDTKKLRDLCAGVAATRTVPPRCAGGALALGVRPSGRPPLQVLVTTAASPTPLGLNDPRIAALVFVSDPAETQRPSERLLRECYGLTPAESDVAARLAMGQTLREIAVARNSAIETVRRQNKKILAKTGARHRSELVQMLSTMLTISPGRR